MEFFSHEAPPHPAVERVLTMLVHIFAAMELLSYEAPPHLAVPTTLRPTSAVVEFFRHEAYPRLAVERVLTILVPIFAAMVGFS